MPVERRQEDQEPGDADGDAQGETLEFKLSVPALQGGTFEARVYPRGDGGLGDARQSDQMVVDPMGSLPTETPVGRTSNLRYPALDTAFLYRSNYQFAHSFTTGPKTGGYTIEKIRIPLRISYSGYIPKVSIHPDVNGRPGTALHTLNLPADSGKGSFVAEFTSSNVNLSASTTYWMIVSSAVAEDGGFYTGIFLTLFTEDGGVETGWSISDGAWVRIEVVNDLMYRYTRGSGRHGAVIPLMEFVEKRGVANSAPVISTSANITTGENVTQVATLAATDEYIPDGGLAWAIRSGTDGGADRDKFVLSRDGTLLFGSPKDFEAKDDANGDGVYEVSVQVSDEAETTTKSLQVTLQDTNESPSADAGADRADVDEGATVTLSGTGSDPDAGDTAGTLSYRWRQTDGLSDHHVSLVNANTATATFTAPTGLLEDATLGFVLTVTDDGGLSTDDEMSVRVTAQGPIPEEGLVGNLGQAAGSSLSIDTGGAAYAQAFTTGPVNSRFSGVRLSTSVGDRTEPQVAVHADRDGVPGSRLRSLPNPSSLDDDTETAEEFTTSTLVLQANTTYWVVVARASGSGAVGLGTAASTAEDDSAAAGWTITGSAWQRSGSAWSEVAGSRAIKLAILGEENPYVLSWAVSSRPMSGETYGAGEKVELEFTFNEPVVTGNLMRIHLWVGPPNYTASYRSSRYAWGSGTRKLVFSYKVQERDVDDNGFSTDAGFLRPVGPITDHSGEVPANVSVDAGEAGTDHKVNGGGETGCPMVLCATVTVAEVGDSDTHGAGHYDSGNIGNISNRVFYYQEDNYPLDDPAYVLMEVLVRDGGQLEVLLNRPPGEVLLQELRFTVGDKDFPLRSGLVHGSRITWRNTGLTWAAGDKVSVMVTGHTAVGNLLQDVAGRVGTSATAPALAQSFTTGSENNGYILLAARLLVQAYPGAVPTVSVYSDNSGAPGESLHRLSRRVWFWYGGTNRPDDFMASDFPLAPSTTYWLVVEKLADKRDVTMLVTETTDEDPGAASGWSLGDAGQSRSNGAWSPLAGTADTMQLAILAMPANRAATGAPVVVGVPKVNRPLLVDIKGISDPDGLTGVSYAYQWTVEFGNGEMEDIPGATGASYLPRATDRAKRLGVRVSFTDDVGNREELTSPGSPLVGTQVSNLGQPDVTLDNFGIGILFETPNTSLNRKYASSFTTGSQVGGYTLHSVLLRVRGSPATLKIYSTGSKDRDGLPVPGTSLHTLTEARTYNALEMITRTYTSSGFTLQPSTTYWVVVASASDNPRGANDLDVTAFADEDEGSGPGWSISNYRTSQSHGGLWGVSRGDPFRPTTLRMAVLAE